MLKRQVKAFKQLFRIAQLSRRIAPFYRRRYYTILLWVVRLCREEKFTPDEAFEFGLFNPALTPSELSKFSSRKKLTKIQESLNPVSWAPLLKNKGIFYRYCMTLGVPIPKLYAIFFKKTAGWSFDKSVLKSPADWKEFFDTRLPSEFVIKPAITTYGYGLNIFTRNGHNFVDTSGNSLTPGQIYEKLLSDPQYDSFVIQQRLKSHPELIRFSNTEFLQTVRFITFVDTNNNSRIIHTNWKPIVGPNIVDNWQDGQSGNLIATISLDTGILKSAVKSRPNSEGIQTIPNHPQTGLRFDGFQMPLWPQTCKLVEETAPRFVPIRTIAWDVAITPDASYIVEGNIWWEPPNQQRRMDVILGPLMENNECLKQSLFTNRKA